MKARFILKFSRNEEWFKDNEITVEVEIVRVLEEISRRIKRGDQQGSVLDLCGNTMGKFEVTRNQKE